MKKSSPIKRTETPTPAPTPDPASLVACSHFGCDAQPGEPCSDTSFAGGEITTTPFLIGGQPAFHAERVATRTQIATIGQPSELPSQKDFDKAVEDSGLV